MTPINKTPFPPLDVLEFSIFSVYFGTSIFLSSVTEYSLAILSDKTEYASLSPIPYWFCLNIGFV